SRPSDSPSKSPLWRLPPDVLTNLQLSYWTRRSSHGPPDGGPAGAVPPAGFVLGSGGSARKAPAAGRVSPPRRLRSGANTAPHQPRGPPGAGVRRELAVRPPWRLPCTARRAL